MSWEAIQFVMEMRCSPSGASLSTCERAVANYLAYRHSESERKAWPGGNTIGEAVNLSRSRVSKIIRSLCEKRVIQSATSANAHGNYQPSEYRFVGLDVPDDGKVVRPTRPNNNLAERNRVLNTPHGEDDTREPCAESDSHRVLNSADTVCCFHPIPCAENSTIKNNRKTRNKNKREIPPVAVATGDPRHYSIRKLIQTLTTEKTGLNPAPWDGRDAKALAKFLKSNPSWDVPTIERLVRNRFDSEEASGKPAHKWIPNLSAYAEGPLNKYGNLQTLSEFDAGIKFLEEYEPKYSDTVRDVVNYLGEIWPKIRPGDQSPVPFDLALVSSRTDYLLTNGCDAELLKSAVRRYVGEKKSFPISPEKFLSDNTWRPYYKLETHIQAVTQ